MLKSNEQISMGVVLKRSKGRVIITWLIVLLENLLLALTPLFMGFAIDGLLNGQLDELWVLGGILVCLVFVAVGRRIYDTRVYSAMRLRLGSDVATRHMSMDVSALNARLDMSRELIDFLELEAPETLTAIIQIVISLIILTIFNVKLGISSAAVIVAMLLFYALFHKRFFDLNAKLNSQTEKQVAVLGERRRLSVFRHLRSLRSAEVSISDTEALLYGGIFLLQIGYIMFNIYLAANLPDVTAGRIFSIATYSWEYVEAALMLPIALQGWSRISEITKRLNSRDHPAS